MDPTYPLVPIANFLACFIVLLPLTTSIRRSWNIGVIAYASWVAVEAFYTAIDCIVWRDKSRIVVPVWCDITSHIGVGSSIAIPACSLSITRRLYRITSQRNLITTKNDRIREMTFDLLLCLGLPVVSMILYYVIQGARFQVVEELGCLSAGTANGVSIILNNIWTPLLPAISATVYCPRIAWTFYQHRKEVNEFLSSSTAITRGSYLRIMALGCIDVVLVLPLSILLLVQGYEGAPIVFWPGWKEIHSDWGPASVPADEWKPFPWDNFEVRWDEWINVLLAVVFFALFGLTEEAINKYRYAFLAIARRLGYIPAVKAEASAVAFDTRGGEATTARTSLMLSSFQDTNSSEMFPPIEKIGEGIRDDTTPTHDSDSESHTIASKQDLERGAFGI